MYLRFKLASFVLGLVNLVQLFAAGAEDHTFTALKSAPTNLHNVFQLTPRVFSGSQPEGDECFAWLAKRGIRTIVTVDGAQPDVERAHRFGLRYVHLPIGYDGVSTGRVAELTRVAELLPGPFYVHCHHGKHRGPAAAAVFCESSERWSPQQAEAFLKEAGTSLEYPGLYRSVREFKAVDPKVSAALPKSFPETVTTPGLVSAMINIDGHLERLHECGKAQWRTPSSHPDVSPGHEAVLLWESFRELQRSGEIRHPQARFREMMSVAEAAALRLKEGLAKTSAFESQVCDQALRDVVQSCSSCHKEFRNSLPGELEDKAHGPQ